MRVALLLSCILVIPNCKAAVISSPIPSLTSSPHLYPCRSQTTVYSTLLSSPLLSSRFNFPPTHSTTTTPPPNQNLKHRRSLTPQRQSKKPTLGERERENPEIFFKKNAHPRQDRFRGDKPGRLLAAEIPAPPTLLRPEPLARLARRREDHHVIPLHPHHQPGRVPPALPLLRRPPLPRVLLQPILRFSQARVPQDLPQ